MSRSAREELYEIERWWADLQPLLESMGYMLRERFRPDWIPSYLPRPDDPSYKPVPRHLAPDYWGFIVSYLSTTFISFKS